MAVTVLADVIVPSIFTPYVQLLTKQSSAFVQSGVILDSPEFDRLLAGGGKTFELSGWNDLADTESNVSSDTGGDSTTQNIGTHKDIAIRHSRNQTWGAADLVTALAGADPMQAIAILVAGYWRRQLQRITIQSLLGVLADNEAAPGGSEHVQGDMVHSIATDSASAITDAELFSADAFLAAVQTMGDAGEDLVAVGVHSVVFRRMQTRNLIDFIPDSESKVDIPFFLGRRVIVDDGLPAVSGSNRITYTTTLFGRGSVGLGTGQPKVPNETDRNPKANNGGGEEELTSRVEWIVHPRGVKFTSSSLAGQSPTNTELAAAANWERVYTERKQIPLAFLKTNG